MSLYQKSEIPREEQEVLSSISYPTEVSLKVVGGYLKSNSTVLDIGAGTNTELGTLVKGRGGLYTPVDIWPAALDAQREAGFSPLTLGASNLEEVRDKSYGLAHMRFVLMHLLNPQERLKSIAEALRVGKRAAFIEYDWQEGVPWSEADVFEQFKKLGLKFLKGKADPYYGSMLEDEVRGVLEKQGVSSRYNVNRQEHTSGPLTDYTEPIARCEAILAHAKGEQNSSLQSLAEEVLDELRVLSRSHNPPVFYRPLIVSVFVEPKTHL